MPRPMARWVLPMPGGPSRTTFSALGTLGRWSRLKSSRVLTAGKCAVRIRMIDPADSRSATWRSRTAARYSSWDQLRFSNVMDPEDYAVFPSFDADAMLRKWNLWGYIDGRDGAQAVSRALENAKPGFETFIIAAADTVMSRSSAELAAEVFPGVGVVKEVGERETLLSIDKARRMLGYAPEHSWRDHAGSVA